jgi:hypothetical protein
MTEMIDYDGLRNFFAIVGIGWFASKIVIGAFTLYDQINLWGFEKGIKRWLHIYPSQRRAG